MNYISSIFYFSKSNTLAESAENVQFSVIYGIRYEKIDVIHVHIWNFIDQPLLSYKFHGTDIYRNLLFHFCQL